MIKTHNKTGLKYLCQTKRKNPFKYPGSGKHWRSHLNFHGYDFSTEIIGVYETKEELKEAGIHYSNLFNIVESNEWANLRIEDGDGGDTSSTDGYKVGMRKRRSYTGEGNPNFGKVGCWSGKVGPQLNKTWYNDGTKELLSQACPEGWVEGRLKITCQYCGKQNTVVNHKRWHGENCKGKA